MFHWCVCVRQRYMEVLWNVSIKIRRVRAENSSLSVSAHLEPLTAPTLLLHHRLCSHTKHHVIALWIAHRLCFVNDSHLSYTMSSHQAVGQTFHLEQEIVFHRELLVIVNNVVSAYNGDLWEVLLCVTVGLDKQVSENEN